MFIQKSNKLTAEQLKNIGQLWPRSFFTSVCGTSCPIG